MTYGISACSPFFASLAAAGCWPGACARWRREAIGDSMTKPSVRNSDIVQDELKTLHDTYGLSWRQIAALPSYGTIPPGTLCSIANGKPIPNKHRPAVGLPKLVRVRADRVKGPSEPPRNLIRCTFYRGTTDEKIAADLLALTGKRWRPDEGELEY